MDKINTSHQVLKTPSIIPLSSPGSDSNYLDWAMILRIHFRASGVGYLISKDSQKPNQETITQDNLAVCSVISRSITASNFQFIRKHKESAVGMWNALRDAHQDNSSRGRMYWLRKLLLTRLNDKEMTTHLSEIVSYGEKLSSLITADNPLTADDLQLTAILLSLPDNWLSCVSSMMNKESVPPAKLIAALKQEHLCCQTRNEDALANSAKLHQPKGSTIHNRTTDNRSPRTYFCTHFNVKGHSFSRCTEVQKLLQQLKRTNNKPKNRSGTSEPKSANANLIKTNSSDIDSDSDDFSDSQVIIHAGSAAVCNLINTITNPQKDFNLDSGCSVSMTPYSDQVKNRTSDNTVIRLADGSTILSTEKGIIPFRFGHLKLWLLLIFMIHYSLSQTSATQD